MIKGLELIIKEFKRTLEKYPTCDECDILDMMEKELNIK